MMISTGCFGGFSAESMRLNMLPTDRSVRPRRVLVIEDERSTRELVSDQLHRAGYECRAVSDGRKGLELGLTEPFDVVVLDLILPGIDGITLCRTIRQKGVNRDVPILVLTARRAESDKVLGLESGADDYVTKPFGVRELTARIGALTRRVDRANGQRAPAPQQAIAAHGVAVDPAKHLVWVREAHVTLTPHEFELLYQLASKPGVVLTRQELLALVWRGQAFVTERSIDTLVRHLRCKIEQDPDAPRLILTVWGYGYKFKEACPDTIG
jgi:two-component system alkaline phosphatase synthesis response regulator PhoP